MKAVQRAKAALLVMQFYDVVKSNVNGKGLAFDVSSLYELKTEKSAAVEAVEILRPTDVCASKTGKGAISLHFTCLSPDELKTLSECGTENQIKYKCLLTKRGESEGKEFELAVESDGSFTFTPSSIEDGAPYVARVRVVHAGKESVWSGEAELLQDGC